DRLAQLLDGAGAPPDQLVVLALDDLAGVGPGPGQQEVAVAVGGGLLQGGGEVGLPAAVALHYVEAPPELAFEAGDGLHAGLAGRRGGGRGGVPVPVLAVALAAALLPVRRHPGPEVGTLLRRDRRHARPRRRRDRRCRARAVTAGRRPRGDHRRGGEQRRPHDRQPRPRRPRTRPHHRPPLVSDPVTPGRISAPARAETAPTGPR